jgi:hypothetical protein
MSPSRIRRVVALKHVLRIVSIPDLRCRVGIISGGVVVHECSAPAALERPGHFCCVAPSSDTNDFRPPEESFVDAFLYVPAKLEAHGRQQFVLEIGFTP